MERATWLDGLRGIAAAIVATDHYFMGGVLDAAFRSYWADPPEENRKLIQLPPIRILFAAHAMVPLFLVVSGYAISIQLLRIRNSKSPEFLRRMSSAVTRRVLRIYLPVFCITVISQVLYFCNLYQWDFGDEIVWGRKPWTAPWFHVTFVFYYMMNNLNILMWQDHAGLNGQLWTMAFEFRGSCIVYLVITGLAFWRPQLRLLVLAVLSVYWFHFGAWDVVAFLAGLYLAEAQILSESNPTKSELPHYVQLYLTKAPVSLGTIRTYLCFLIGLWLICLSDDGFLPPGYQFLKIFESGRWADEWGIVSKCWKTIGSIFIVYAIRNSALLKRPLTSRPVQYLGKISFSLYLVHQSIYHLFRNPVRNALWYATSWQSYPGTEEASKRTLSFAFSWCMGFVILTVINLFVADLYTKYIDERCVELAKKFEKWVSL